MNVWPEAQKVHANNKKELPPVAGVFQEEGVAAEYARFLGCVAEDLAGQALHAQIVRHLQSPLPDGWAEHIDDKGRLYYWNEYSGEATWNHPDHDPLLLLVQFAAKVAPLPGWARRRFARTERERLERETTDLVDQWSGPHVDSDGRRFYYDRRRGRSEWRHPAYEAMRQLLWRTRAMQEIVQALDERDNSTRGLAALQIQKVWRGHYSRSLPHGAPSRRALRKLALLRIQKFVRGWRQRRLFKWSAESKELTQRLKAEHQRQDEATQVLQQVWRKKVQGARTQQEMAHQRRSLKRHAAASRIQAVFRGQRARTRLAHEEWVLHTFGAGRPGQVARRRAALRVQAVWRGVRARRRAVALKLARAEARQGHQRLVEYLRQAQAMRTAACAVLIQSVWRGFRGRKAARQVRWHRRYMHWRKEVAASEALARERTAMAVQDLEARAREAKGDDPVVKTFGDKVQRLVAERCAQQRELAALQAEDTRAAALRYCATAQGREAALHAELADMAAQLAQEHVLRLRAEHDKGEIYAHTEELQAKVFDQQRQLTQLEAEFAQRNAKFPVQELRDRLAQAEDELLDARRELQKARDQLLDTRKRDLEQRQGQERLMAEVLESLRALDFKPTLEPSKAPTKESYYSKLSRLEGDLEQAKLDRKRLEKANGVMREDIINRLMASVGHLPPDSPVARVRALGEAEAAFLELQEEHRALQLAHERLGTGHADLEGGQLLLAQRLERAEERGAELKEQAEAKEQTIGKQAEAIAAAEQKAAGLAAELAGVRAELAELGAAHAPCGALAASHAELLSKHAEAEAELAALRAGLEAAGAEKAQQGEELKALEQARAQLQQQFEALGADKEGLSSQHLKLNAVHALMDKRYMKLISRSRQEEIARIRVVEEKEATRIQRRFRNWMRIMGPVKWSNPQVAAMRSAVEFERLNANFKQPRRRQAQQAVQQGTLEQELGKALAEGFGVAELKLPPAAPRELPALNLKAFAPSTLDPPKPARPEFRGADFVVQPSRGPPEDALNFANLGALSSQFLQHAQAPDAGALFLAPDAFSMKRGPPPPRYDYAPRWGR